jgi:hypothetical protein
MQRLGTVTKSANFADKPQYKERKAPAPLVAHNEEAKAGYEPTWT